jgi:hypothetical protein
MARAAATRDATQNVRQAADLRGCLLLLAARTDWRLSQAEGGRVSSPARKSAIAVAIWGAPRRGR